LCGGWREEWGPQNAFQVPKFEELDLSRSTWTFEAGDSTNQKCRGNTRSRTRACLGVTFHCFLRHWTKTTVSTTPY
jgi:hypothetical protein